MYELRKALTGITGVLTLLSSIVTIFVFLSDIWSGKEPMNFRYMLNLVIYISLLYSIGFVLCLYADFFTNAKGLFEIFSWCYVSGAALLFGIFSYNCIMHSSYTLVDYLYYFIIICFIIALGVLMAKGMSVDCKNFSIPFVLVSFGQISSFIMTVLVNFSVKSSVNTGSYFALIFMSFLFIGLFYELDSYEL